MSLLRKKRVKKKITRPMEMRERSIPGIRIKRKSAILAQNGTGGCGVESLSRLSWNWRKRSSVKCSILDGFSRFLVHWDLRESMRETDVEVILQRAKEKYPEAKPRIISDNGPQFIARDFKEFIRISGMTHVRTSPYYPQSNGKIERWNKSIKSECIRPGVPMSLDDAMRLVGQYVEVYNGQRLHSAIGYITPKDLMEGRREQIHAARDHKLEEARQLRLQADPSRKS